MPRSCGIRLGQRSFELVVLDGSPRKARLVGHASGELPLDSEDPMADAVAAIRNAAKELKVPTDSIGLAIDTGLAAFRSVRMPFAERAKIDEVIKFEVESQLPQWNIDDVVIDFLVLSAMTVESNLIVTAVPKQEIAKRITTCLDAGLEPQEVELECTAMVNAASQAGLFDEESACVLVHFGDSSTSVAIVDGGALKTLRAIHIGAWPSGPSGERAKDEDAHRHEASGRLRRELLRAITGEQTAHPIEAVYVCGHPAPELVGTEILDVPVEALRLLPDDTGEEAPSVEDPGRYFVAWGAALRQMGGGMLRPSLRREELRFLGKFERLELPLAVLGLLLLTFISVRAIITYKDIEVRKQNLRTWVAASNNYMLGDQKQGHSGNLKRPPDKVREYANNISTGDVAQTEPFLQLQTINSMLQSEILATQRELGRDSTIRPPLSAFEGTTLVLDVLRELGDGIGRFTVRGIESSYYAGKGGREDEVVLKLDLTFRGDGTVQAGRRYQNFLETLREKPWYIEHKDVKETTLETMDGIYMDGLTITIDPSRAESPVAESTESTREEASS